jgi:anti-sigma factor RsiW
MAREFTRSELEAYLEEALPPEETAAIESALRENPELARRLAEINNVRDAGLHSLGEIWRRHRLSCPTRQDLGSYLLGALSDQRTDYIRFHLESIGCRFCRANLADLERQQQEGSEAAASRRRKYFDSSAGYLGGEIRGD